MADEVERSNEVLSRLQLHFEKNVAIAEKAVADAIEAVDRADAAVAHANEREEHTLARLQRTERWLWTALGVVSVSVARK